MMSFLDNKKYYYSSYIHLGSLCCVSSCNQRNVAMGLKCGFAASLFVKNCPYVLAKMGHQYTCDFHSSDAFFFLFSFH